MGKLIAGPADGLDVPIAKDGAWVAVIDGKAVVLPDGADADLEAVLNAAKCAWAWYQRLPGDQPAEESQWRYMPRNWP